MAPPGQASRTGQGHWPTSRAEAACHVLGPAGVQAAGQRLQSVTAPVSRAGTAASGTLPFTDVLLPRSELGRDYTVRSTSLSLPAGFLN